jgi:hypothetical protein
MPGGKFCSSDYCSPSLRHFLLVALTVWYDSVIWNMLLATRPTRGISPKVRNSHSFVTRVFPDLSGIRGHRTPVTHSDWDLSLSPSVNDVLASFATNGPLIPRLILTGALTSPIVSISLQRDAVEIGGNQGILSIGELPAGIAAEDLTWVSLREYTVAEGGLPAPKDSPNEVQPHFIFIRCSHRTSNRFTPSLGRSPWMMCILTGGSYHAQPLSHRTLL